MVEFVPACEAVEAYLRDTEESQRALEELIKCEAENAKTLSGKEDRILELEKGHSEGG